MIYLCFLYIYIYIYVCVCVCICICISMTEVTILDCHIIHNYNRKMKILGY